MDKCIYTIEDWIHCHIMYNNGRRQGFDAFRYFVIRPEVRYDAKKKIWQGFCIDLAKWCELGYLQTTNYDNCRWLNTIRWDMPRESQILYALATSSQAWFALKDQVDFAKL